MSNLKKMRNGLLIYVSSCEFGMRTTLIGNPYIYPDEGTEKFFGVFYTSFELILGEDGFLSLTPK